MAAGCSSLPRTRTAASESGVQANRYRTLALKEYHAGRYARAEAFFLRELAIHAAVDRRPGVVESLASLGRTNLASGACDAAEALFAQALDAAQGLLRPDLEARALGGLGAVALWRGRPEEARDWFLRALELPLDDPGPERAVLLHDLGSALRMLGDGQGAETRLLRALAMHEQQEDRAGIATACYALAELHADREDTEAALPLARRALLLDKTLERPLAVAQDLTLLARLAALRGDEEQARLYCGRAKLAWRALGRLDTAAEIAACDMKPLRGDTPEPITE